MDTEGKKEETTIMATAAKKKRGRPRKYTDEEIAKVLEIWQEKGTVLKPRRINDLINFYRGSVMLQDHYEPEFAWLIDPNFKHGVKRWRQTILTELGRIQDDDELLALAREVCRLRLKSVRAVRALRAVRLGRRPKGDVETLADRILRAINEYLCGHDGIGDEDVIAALSMVARWIGASKKPAA